MRAGAKGIRVRQNANALGAEVPVLPVFLYRSFGPKGTYSVGVPERFDHVRRIIYIVYT